LTFLKLSFFSILDITDQSDFFRIKLIEIYRQESFIYRIPHERTMKSSIITSSHPRSVAVGDFNKDNYLDVVVTNSEEVIEKLFIMFLCSGLLLTEHHVYSA